MGEQHIIMGEQHMNEKTQNELYGTVLPWTGRVKSGGNTVHIYRDRCDDEYFGQQSIAVLPEQKTTEAYCYDICAFLPVQTRLRLEPLTTVRVPTGLFLALPPHWAALVCSRSGLAAKGVQVINAPGVIDADYRDEVQVLLSYIAPPTAPPFVIEHGMRIAQLLYLPPTPYLVTHDVPSRLDLPQRETNRAGGFGSTGV
jgi:dUTP pyrophosphatase